MESLFCYKSDEENDDPSELEDRTEQTEHKVMELDANYDSVTMEMSEDSESSITGEDGKKEKEEQLKKLEKIHTRPLLSSPSSSTPISSPSSSSSSKSDTSSPVQKPLRKKVEPQGIRRSRSPRRRKSYDHESSGSEKNYSRNSESDHYEERKRDRYKRLRNRRSRSPKRSHHQSRKSRSPVYRRKSSSRYRSHGSSYRDRDRVKNSYRKRSRSRSRSRSHGYSSKKPSKLSVLGRLGIELKIPAGSMSEHRAMQERIAKVKNATGITLPSYYNPIAVNPSKYAEQVQKRKLLWGGSKANNVEAEKKEDVEEKCKNIPSGPPSLWQGATFSQDQDGKLTAKFKRLMGIKNTDEVKQDTATSTSTDLPAGNDLLKKQEEMFNSMEMQYEVARVATHTHRGVGLGFGVHQFPR